MKLIYEIQDINLLSIFNMFEGWSNGHNFAFRVFDHDLDRDEVLINGNALSVIEELVSCMINGDADQLGHCKIFGEWS